MKAYVIKSGGRYLSGYGWHLKWTSSLLKAEFYTASDAKRYKDDAKRMGGKYVEIEIREVR